MEYSTHAPTHAKAIHNTVQNNKRDSKMGIISGAISSAGTTPIVEQANQLKATSQSKLTPEKSAAKTAKNTINSIFTAAKSNLQASVGEGNSQVSTTTADIKGLADHAISLGQENESALALINQAKDLVNTYTEQIKQKNNELQTKQQEQAQVKSQIEQLGGQVDGDQQTPTPTSPSPEPSTESGGADEITDTPAPEVQNGNTPEVKGKRSKKAGKTHTNTPKVSKPTTDSGNLEQLQAKYKSLGQDIKGISDSIGELQNSKISEQNNIIQENTGKYTTNLSNIESDRGTMQTKKSEGETNLKSTQNKMQATAEQDAKNIGKELSSQTQKMQANLLESNNDLTISGELKTIAQQADKNDTNKQKLQQLSRDFKKLSKDFGDKNGVAKDNSNNVNEAKGNIDKLDAALSNAIKGDFANMNQSIYEAYQTAIQQTDMYATNKLDGGGDSPSGTDAKSLKGADSGSGGKIDIGSFTSIGLNSLQSLIPSGDENTTAGQMFNAFKDIGFQVLSSFI